MQEPRALQGDDHICGEHSEGQLFVFVGEDPLSAAYGRCLACAVARAANEVSSYKVLWQAVLRWQMATDFSFEHAPLFYQIVSGTDWGLTAQYCASHFTPDKVSSLVLRQADVIMKEARQLGADVWTHC